MTRGRSIHDERQNYTVVEALLRLRDVESAEVVLEALRVERC